jgi:hypothetical protein
MNLKIDDVKNDLKHWSLKDIAYFSVFAILIASNWFMCHRCSPYDPKELTAIQYCIDSYNNQTVKKANFTINFTIPSSIPQSCRP